MVYKKIIKATKGVFVAPIKKYYFGKIKYAAPRYFDFHPRKFNKTILSISKSLPLEINGKRYNRNPNFDIFGYNISYGFPIWLHYNDLGWKDKFNSPRFEFSPMFVIYFFNWQFCIWWNSPDRNNDLYYEMILWWLNYSDKNIDKAEKTWGWTSSGKSTWNEKYLINTKQERRDKILSKIVK